MKDSIRAWLSAQFGEDEALFAELYGQYAADMKQLAETLPGHLSAGECAALGEKGHSMKGMALQVGDTDLSDPCMALQNEGRAGNLAACGPLVDRICAAVAAL